MRHHLTAMILGSLLLAPVAGVAQDLPNLREARAMVFAEDGAAEGEVIGHESLSATDLAILERLVPTQAYYAAVAIAPDAGLAAVSTVAAANYHDTENASRAALEGCNAAREGGRDCVIVLLIRPEGYEAGRDLQLNTAATAALGGDFRALRRPRVMAISEMTGQWGIGADVQAATEACAAEDCRAVIAD